MKITNELRTRIKLLHRALGMFVLVMFHNLSTTSYLDNKWHGFAVVNFVAIFYRMMVQFVRNR